MAITSLDNSCRSCGGPLARMVRDGRCVRCGAPVPRDVLRELAHGGRLTNFGYGVIGWATGFLIGLNVSCCHFHGAGMLLQRHVLTPLITGIVGALVYVLVGRALDSGQRLGFELVALSLAAGIGGAAFVSASSPCTAATLGAVALLVAVGVSILLARSSFLRHETSGQS